MLKNDLEEIELLLEMAIEEDDDSLEKDIELSIEKMQYNLDKVRIKTLLDGEYDKNNAILSINAGTGGLDAQDCAQILLRMYTRWANNKGYKVKTLDYLPDTEAGIKSVTLSIEGLNAYGYLKSEKGVHRIVRISPYDTSGKRHTSFVSVDITPELDDDIDVQINPSDLKIDTYRASGAGGQHVNTTIDFRVTLRGTDCRYGTAFNNHVDNVLFTVYGRYRDILIYPLQSRCLL